MKVNKDIEPRNTKGEVHGYQERYHNNKLYVRCNYKNGLGVGYYEWHLQSYDYQLQTRFHIR